MTHLENVSTEELREILVEVKEKRATKRLMVAINWKEEDGATQKEIAERYGYTQGWLSQWLQRLERLESEPFEDVVYDDHRSGRNPKLSDEEFEHFVDVLHESPEDVGFDFPGWTVPLARQYLEDEFGVEYSRRHVRRLMAEAGLSWKTARPNFDKSDERAQEAWKEGFKKREPIWTTTTK